MNHCDVRVLKFSVGLSNFCLLFDKLRFGNFAETNDFCLGSKCFPWVVKNYNGLLNERGALSNFIHNFLRGKMSVVPLVAFLDVKSVLI